MIAPGKGTQIDDRGFGQGAGYDSDAVRVAFLLKDLQLSGGVGVVLTHARNLSRFHGFDVTLVTTESQDEPDWEYGDLPHLHVLSLGDAGDEEFDIAISTWWETAYSLFQLRARRYASFVQSLEDRFYEGHESIERLGARLSLELPVSFITEAEWIAESLRELRPDAEVRLVRNGIDKETFGGGVLRRSDAGPLRVLIEGSPESWFKGVGDALQSVELMSEPHVLTLVCPTREGLPAQYLDSAIGPLTTGELAGVYAENDVLLKLSQVEGMYGPPLEAFHQGVTCVTTEVTGHGEFIAHGRNALVVDWDDNAGTASQLDMLARDRALLARLREGALETAARWPSWEVASDRMAQALTEISEAQPPDYLRPLPNFLAIMKAGLEQERGARGHYRKLRADAGRWQRINSLPALAQLLAARRALKKRVRDSKTR